MPEKRFKFLLISILTVVFLVVISRPIVFWKDSYGYLTMEVYRSAGYPIFLSLLKCISVKHLDLLTVISQIGIGLTVIYSFITRLKKHIIMHPVWFLFLTLIIATPFVYNHKLANNYLSEALTYSLYLLVTLFFLESLLTEKTKSLWISLPVLTVLVMFRTQFLFMLPVAFLIVLWLAFRKKTIKKYLPITMGIVLLPFVTSLTDKTFHYVKHGYFVNTPWTGIPLSTPAYYVSDAEDYLLYDDPVEQQFFKAVHARLAEQHLNIHHLPDVPEHDESSYYILHFPEISNGTLHEYGRELLGENLSEAEQFIALDTLTKKMVLPLVLDNFKLWLKVYIKNIVNGFGNSKYLLLYAILLSFGLYGMVKKPSPVYKTISLLLILTFGNLALVSLGMHTIKRFTFYNDWVVFMAVFMLMDAYFKQNRLAT